MKYVIKNDRAAAVEAEARCHAHMIATVRGYCAERWADIREHLVAGVPDGKYGFYTDQRVELALTPEERAARIDELREAKDWEKIEKSDRKEN